jgi:DNA-binding CsgD family transcriptional regulator
LVGRDRERAEIWALLEAARSSRSSSLVLRGEAGIGKSALLDDARDRAVDMHVLTARGVESESELAFAALHQLLRPALTHLDRIPAPQAAAVGSALGLGGQSAEERFLVFAGCLSLLSELAERRPVLCLVDDAHWLDAASSDALQFVARRLDAEGIVMLFAAREGDVRRFDAPDLRTLRISGLDSEAAGRLLAPGVSLSPAVRDRLLAQTQGNALALVELPAALTTAQLTGREPLPEALPMTRQLEKAFNERVRHLPGEVRSFLLVAAADDSEDVRLAARAAERLGASRTGLDLAETAGLVKVHGTRLEFRHPLVRSAVYGAATSTERRAAHRALAETLAEGADAADRRAWHLAAAAIEPDAEVVRALDETASRAEARAGHGAAAKALQRAAELSREPSEAAQRLVRAARDLSIAGVDDQAVAVANRAAPLVADPALHAELAHVRGVAAVRSGRPAEVVQVLVDAARDVAELDPERAVHLLMDASIAAWQGADAPTYLEIARLSATVVPPSSALARSLSGFAAMIDGDTATGIPCLVELAEWGREADEPGDVVWASFGALWLGDEAGFGSLIDRAAGLARARGELGVLSETLGMYAGHLVLAQRFDEGRVAAAEAAELARDLNARNLELLPLAALAVIAAIQGRDADAERDAHAVREQATASGLRMRASTATYALALVDLGRGRWAEALERFDSLLEGGAGSLDPIVGPTLPDKVEAAVRASKVDEARSALGFYEQWAAYTGSASAQPRLEACRALLAEVDDASDHYESAIDLGREARPFDLARIRLLYGEHLRRERRRTDARAQLRAALESFEGLRAEPWADRARAELRATGETARRRDAGAVDQLTAQELQISRFVAEGMSNKEIAAHLFLSPRTIDSHLRNVFSKLGITSRTQLARIPLDGSSEAAEVAPAARA